MRIHDGREDHEIPLNRTRFQWQKLAVFFLLCVILYAMVMGITEVVRGLYSDLALRMVGLGLVFAWGLIRFGKRSWTVAVFTFLSGVILSSMMAGRLWDDWQDFWRHLFEWFGSLVQALVKMLQGQFAFPSFGTLFILINDFTGSVFIMLRRFVLWFVRFPRLNEDLIAILMVWSLLMWVATIWAAWNLWRRRRPLEAVVPAFVMLAGVRSYSNESSIPILIMLGASIALMILFAQVDRERDWESRGIGFSGLIRKNSAQTAVMLSALLVFISGGITTIDLDKMKERWEELTHRQLNSRVSDSGVPSSLGIDRDTNRDALVELFDQFSKGGLPSSHLVGTGPELSEEVIMVVKIDEIDPDTGDSLNLDPTIQTYYFRSLAYDQYNSDGWSATPGRIYIYRKGQEAVSTYTGHQKLIKQDVRFENRESTLNKVYVVGDLAVVDRLYDIYWREGESLADFTDMFGATIDGWSYEAYSIVPVFSETDLREASSDYPDWILDRYLQLPETVPDRVINLAHDLTSVQLSAYDKAVVIEQYLRSFSYTLDLPTKTTNRDLVDTFLFELHRGYCDYFASAMVVLARAAGIPARLAVGYLSGTYDLENDSYVITADQAHSWVEVYFPEYGWVTFEPTAGRTPLSRETEEVNYSEFYERQIVFGKEKVGLSWIEILGWGVLGIVGFMILSLIVWLRLDVIILRRHSINMTLAKLYGRLQFFGRLLGIERGIAQTPLEFSAEMSGRIEVLRAAHRPLGYLDKSGKTLESLVMLANQAAYRAEAADIFDRAKAVNQWVILRRQLGLAIFWKWLMGLIPEIKLGRQKA